MLKKMMCLIFLLPTVVFATQFVEGKDYQILTKTITQDNAKPNIKEFFSYGCPWCYKIEPQLHAWMATLDPQVPLDRVPVVFHPDWEVYAKAYYAAKILKVTDTLTPALFKAIQEEKKQLNQPQAMVDFLVANHIDKAVAQNAMTASQPIDLYVSNGKKLMADYQINAVPAFVVNNKYKTDLSLAGDPKRLFEILDYLVRKQ